MTNSQRKIWATVLVKPIQDHASKLSHEKSLNSKVGFVGTWEKLQIHMKWLKSFPNCKFAEKRLFVHWTYKCDEKSTKSDYPFTHVSRKTPTLPKIAPAKSSSARPALPLFPSIDAVLRAYPVLPQTTKRHLVLLAALKLWSFDVARV